MIQHLIQNFSNQALRDFFKRKIPQFSPDEESFDHVIEEYGQFSQLAKLGAAEYENTDELLVFSCKYEGELTQRSSKKKQFEIAKKVLKEDFKDGAVFVFYDEAGKFRFSFIRKHYGDQDEKFTPWRRYTYFVQPDKYNKTFKRRIEACSFQSLEEIQEAFSVEPLSKDFYKELSKWYFYALTQVEFPNDRDEDPHTLRANAMIRLITRLIFVWFMKQNRLVPDGLFDKEQVDRLINYQDATGSTYYKAILQNLFFATLNTPPEKERKFVNRQYGVQGFYRYKRLIEDEDRFLELMKDIPFLNGGLFENLDQVGTNSEEEIRVDCFSDRKVNEERLKVPDYLFFGSQQANLEDYLGKKHQNEEVTGLIDLLNRYDFTIDENTPYDQEVALDPELLGLVFENLLASYNPETESTARKESGSFYTPREVVDFMVEESLLEHLAQQTQLNRESLKALFKNNDEQPFEKQEDKAAIVNALSNVKLIDPACGSGAFPMGALQKMVHVLSLVDHDNQMWKERQKEIAIEETKEAYEIGDHEERRHRLEAIEQAFEEGVKEPDYARKLFLIENTMYGVDIQPIAIQIAKLRFFIALLVDQETEPDRENFGIMALPNLETKFVAADTLAPLPGATGQYGISWQFIEPLEKELNQVRHELFSARTTRTKEKKRQRHMEIQEEIGRVLQENGFPDKMAEAIKSWNAFDPNTRADWFDPEWMFGLNKFDIVLGNPPYIQLQKAIPGDDKNKFADLYKDEGYKTFERTGDIYALFFEQGINILKPNALLCFITSNKWMRSNYGKSLRKFFAGKKPLKLIDLGPGVFESATVDTCIVLLQNTRAQQHQLRGLTLRSRNQISAIKPEDMMAMTTLNEDSWIVLKPEEQNIKEKIERLGTPLRDWDVRINYGIKTGYNPAFIIDGQKKDELIAQDPKSAEIIKPILRGRDIKRYKAAFADLWLLNTHNGYKKTDGSRIPPIDVNEYPAVKRHLDQFWDKIQPRSDQGVTPYNLRNCSYLEEFEKEKVMYREMVKQGEFLYDENSSYFCNDTGRIITGKNLKFLVGLFNSRFFFFAIKRFYGGGGLGSEGVRMKHTFFDKCPVPTPSGNIKKKFEDYVGQIQAKKENNQDTTSEEQQIDLMVYKLYDLTYDEVLVVDPEVPFRREKYEQFSFETLNI